MSGVLCFCLLCNIKSGISLLLLGATSPILESSESDMWRTSDMESFSSGDALAAVMMALVDVESEGV